MSDRLYTYPIDKLLNWILKDLEQDKIFGYSKELFFKPAKDNPFKFKRYGQLLGTPVGVAAGPHTQMSQNIILSWLFGARYIELKTVQTLDELEVSKPCIDLTDEGFNCEWSQELKVHESFDEYLNAWIIIHILKDIFGLNNNEDGFIFNISVGYNLEGIKQPNVQWFLDKINNCQTLLDEKVKQIENIYPRISELSISPQLSDNVTLSTMHGCPPDEIESIVSYLITERKLHTAVKLNPTLLGKNAVREILNDKLGYDITIPDEAFAHDLKWDDAIAMIERLQVLADSENIEFGLKLTNTLESINIERFLPDREKMVYMSGRALHPISINLAAKLQNHFNGKLDISFSAGVDAFNIAETLKCNLKPITVCSDLLKPGGYSRLAQYFEELEKSFNDIKVKNINNFILSNSNKLNNVTEAGLSNLNDYAHKVIEDKRYAKKSFQYKNIKTERKLTPYDCIHAPCVQTCAISQDVPEYMYYASQGDFDNAFAVINKTNPLPNITGMVCDHLCQSKCTRINYDSPLLIREIKRYISSKAADSFKRKAKQKNKIKAAIIGAGPSGLSAAYFLALEGVSVDIYEAKNIAGGMAADAIPVFRITEEAIKRDIDNIKSLGAEFHFNTFIDKNKFDEIRNKSDYVFVSIGAAKGKKLGIIGETEKGVFDQINFLAEVLHNRIPELGKSVAIIGGGLSAVDAARTAKRIVGPNGNVSVIYRRTKNEMPCGWEEVEIMEEEGIEIIELTSPKSIENENSKLRLNCIKMQLGELDDSGRRKPIPISDSDFALEFDSIITAIGQDISQNFFLDDKIKVNNETMETQIPNVFAGGDAIRGADSLINAMADGQKVSEIILQRMTKSLDLNSAPVRKLTDNEFQEKLAKRKYGINIPTIPIAERNSFDLVHPLMTEKEVIEEASRCLFCNDVCNICVTVCPNLSNLSVKFETQNIKYPIIKFNNNEFEIIEYRTISIEQTHQIINLGDFCNECGNCDTFCPTSGAPYKTKPKFYLTEESFNQEDNCYFINKNTIKFKSGNTILSLTKNDEYLLFNSQDLFANISLKDYSIEQIDIYNNNIKMFNFEKVFEMIILFQNLRNNAIFK